MTKKTRIIFLFVTILIIFILLISLLSSTIINKFSSDTKITRTWTKAICNGNICEDYEIACNNKSFVSLFPTGNIVHISTDWKDPRNEEDINKLC